jgi:hypothetical protein
VFQDLSAQELEVEARLQKEVTLELAEFTNMLKEATLNMNQSVREQNKVI